jgi:hypothetical protein
MVVKSGIVFFTLSSSYLLLFWKEGIFYTAFRTATRVLPDTERVSLKRTLISQGRCPSLMTRSAVLNGPSLHRQRKDVTGGHKVQVQ